MPGDYDFDSPDDLGKDSINGGSLRYRNFKCSQCGLRGTPLYSHRNLHWYCWNCGSYQDIDTDDWTEESY